MSAANTSAANTEAGRRSRTPSANVERELVAAAEAVLVRDGPGGVTVRAVAAEAGIAPMGVYNRLGGKDGLVEALLIIGFDRLRAAIESGPEPDMMERMRACAMRYREFALTNRHFYAIMFEDAIPHEHMSDEVRDVLRTLPPISQTHQDPLARACSLPANSESSFVSCNPGFD